MARRRRRNQGEESGYVLVIILVIWGLTILKDRSPLWFSVISGMLVVLIFGGILVFIQRNKRRKANLIARNYYYDLDPYQFEHAVAELFRQRGYDAQVTPKSGDRGIDILLKKEGERMAVQCKRFRDRIGPGIVREFVGAMEGIDCKRGYIVTTSDFSQEAKRAADNSRYHVHLVNGKLLGEWQNLIQKSLNTDLLTAKWWGEMTKAQKGIILGLFLLVVFTAVTGGMYLFISWPR